ncbi:hypothetical protein GCM10023340_17730 [Nocardioides marinquilinus]|uniref:Uncharacterized protein n=1 Tax=Nocardioides marinquilinus TaxID=1210400 RepID=A0ABP9PHH9_9ACTN
MTSDGVHRPRPARSTSPTTAAPLTTGADVLVTAPRAGAAPAAPAARAEGGGSASATRVTTAAAHTRMPAA